MRTSAWTTAMSRLTRRSTRIIALVAIIAVIGAVAGSLFATQKAHAWLDFGCNVAPDQGTPTCTFKGLTATEYADTLSADGCIDTFVYVLAAQGFTNNPAYSSSSGNGVEVAIGQYDNCNQVPISYDNGYANNVNFTMDNALKSATLSATVTLTRWESPDQSTYPVTVNLTWLGSGATFQSINDFHYRISNQVMNSHEDGSLRGAQVSGVVSSDTVTNYISSPNMNGNLESVTSGQVIVSQ